MLLTMDDTRRLETIQLLMEKKISVNDAALVLGVTPRQAWR